MSQLLSCVIFAVFYESARQRHVHPLHPPFYDPHPHLAGLEQSFPQVPAEESHARRPLIGFTLLQHSNALPVLLQGLLPPVLPLQKQCFPQPHV